MGDDRILSYPETHTQGILHVDETQSLKDLNGKVVDLGIQINHDGRIWICIDGISFMRFSTKILEYTNG